MEMELFTEEITEDENFAPDDKTEDYLDTDGERCGICMEVVIDRGVLDCCQHWFCFACIDNWATITSLCPLCQNEFQMITCVPVYDTVGGNNTDEDTDSRDEDWFIEGQTNSVSFPGYYIDENAVVCLDGDGCKIRSGSVAIEEDSDIDTSIACDKCDKWYHAFCVGFDPDGTCDSSWLCPRCLVDKVPPKMEQYSPIRESNQHGLQIASGSSRVLDSFPGRVSVSVAGVGETAVVISLVEDHQESQEPDESLLECSDYLKDTLSHSSIANMPEPKTGNSAEPNCGQQEVGVPLSQGNNQISLHSTSEDNMNIDDDGGEKTLIGRINDKSTVSHSGPDLDLSARATNSVDMKDKEKDHQPVEPNIWTKEGPFTAGKIVDDSINVMSLNSMVSDEKEATITSTGAKRKRRVSRNMDGGERETHTEGSLSQKKIKATRNTQALDGQSLKSTLVKSKPISSKSLSKDSKFKRASENENGATDIMALIQGTERRSVKQQQHKPSPEVPLGGKEAASGLRLKKIMRRAGDDTESSVVVEELRKKIREAVRNKSSNELGQKLFDPKLLDAFRAALAGSGTENKKPTLDVMAKKSMLQKGKVRESLTKKIYSVGGKRKQRWSRECEVEFWKHRCPKTGRPEKLQTLKSVLNLLRDDSDTPQKVPGNEKEQSSILSRLYLADNSVFPRQNNIVPVSSVKAPDENRESSLTENISKSVHIDHPGRTAKNTGKAQVTAPLVNSKGVKKNVKDVKVSSEKDAGSKADSTKVDRKKWALELLARKTATPGKNRPEVEENNTILKGNYPLLAQLPKDMRPTLATARHNKIPMPVRQAQLYRLTEHLLKKANLSVVCKAAETELAVVDAVNIEKGLADRSNCKLVYLNLCSQEILRRSDNASSRRPNESNPCSTSNEIVPEDANNSFSELEVDEALRNAGLLSDSPPNSPKHEIEASNHKVDSPEKIEEDGPDNVLEVDSHPELDIYGDFEYNLEDDDFAGALISKQPEEQKIKLVLSSINPAQPYHISGLPVHEVGKDTRALNVSPKSQDKTDDGNLTLNSKTEECIVESVGGDGDHKSQDKTDGGNLTLNTKTEECLVESAGGDGDEELSLAECEELYGPDKEPIAVKYPEIVLTTTSEYTVNHGVTGENGDHESKHLHKDSSGIDSNCSNTKVSLTEMQKTEIEKEKASKSNGKRSENYDTVMKKVEAYIKEHIRPLCKSGVITVEQYRWAIVKTTEKVMKYHSKEKSASFLIKEGEKVKKLAEQYIETAPQKPKN